MSECPPTTEAQLRAQLEQARETNRRINRRYQKELSNLQRQKNRKPSERAVKRALEWRNFAFKHYRGETKKAEAQLAEARAENERVRAETIEECVLVCKVKIGEYAGLEAEALEAKEFDQAASWHRCGRAVRACMAAIESRLSLTPDPS